VGLKGIFRTYHHHRCYRNKATLRYVIASRRGAEFVDLTGGGHTIHNWVRGGCHLGMMPANGLLYAPPHPCRCYLQEKLSGMFALAATAGAPRGASPPRLVIGPAFGATAGPAACAEDWPAFRRDNARTASSTTSMGRQSTLKWRVALGTRPGAPIAVGRIVFVPLVDAHQIVALDGADGRVRWRFTADARVDSPPAYHEGALYFGSRDGHVYCLRAADGALAWRFRAAEGERLIGVDGQLESAWPVSGSVLVRDGIAYFAAGRSSHLDGGLLVMGLDARTGEVRVQTQLAGPSYTDSVAENYLLPMGWLPDILQADENGIHMGPTRFDERLRIVDGGPRLSVSGGYLDDAYFKRAPWRHPHTGYGRLIVGDDRRTFCVRMFDSLKGLSPDVYFTPGKRGYRLFAGEPGRAQVWSRRIRIRIRAMAVAGEHLCVAGPPDDVSGPDPLGAFEGRKGGVFQQIEGDSGKTTLSLALPSPPVFNGIAVAHGKAYLSLEDGSVVCLGE
jgi:hypothetical protein